MVTVTSKVPYDPAMVGWLRLHDVPLDYFVNQSRRYERAYLAWETVRQVRNPFFNLGTGFEGYLVGINHSPDEMVATLLEIGRNMLVSNWRLYRHQFLFRTKLMKTLAGELSDSRAIQVWSASLGAALAKLRCNVYLNYATYRFQNETYWAVNRLPFINYTCCEHHIEQRYVLAPFTSSCTSKPDFSLNLLNPSDYDAGFVVSNIGRFGHPLVRAYMREVDRYWWYYAGC